MSTPKNGTTGIHLEDCDDVEIRDCGFVGFDRGVHAVRTTNLKSSGNVFLSPEFSQALSSGDKVALVRSLGMPGDIPPALVGEALRRFGELASDERAAVAELKDSRLARVVGVAADLTSIVQAFAAVVQIGALSQTLAVLFS